MYDFTSERGRGEARTVAKSGSNAMRTSLTETVEGKSSRTHCGSPFDASEIHPW